MRVQWDQHLLKSLSDQTCLIAPAETALSLDWIIQMSIGDNGQTNKPLSLGSQRARVRMYLFVSAGWSVTGSDFLRCWSSSKEIPDGRANVCMCVYVLTTRESIGSAQALCIDLQHLTTPVFVFYSQLQMVLGCSQLRVLITVRSSCDSGALWYWNNRSTLCVKETGVVATTVKYRCLCVCYYY